MAVAIAAGCAACDSGKADRAAIVVKNLLTHRDASAIEAVSCPQHLSSEMLRRILDEPEVRACAPRGAISATNEGLFFEQGVWFVYVGCENGTRLFFSMAPSRGVCGATNTGFVIEKASTEGPGARVLFELPERARTAVGVGR